MYVTRPLLSAPNFNSRINTPDRNEGAANRAGLKQLICDLNALLDDIKFTNLQEIVALLDCILITPDPQDAHESLEVAALIKALDVASIYEIEQTAMAAGATTDTQDCITMSLTALRARACNLDGPPVPFERRVNAKDTKKVTIADHFKVRCFDQQNEIDHFVDVSELTLSVEAASKNIPQEDRPDKLYASIIMEETPEPPQLESGGQPRSPVGNIFESLEAIGTDLAATLHSNSALQSMEPSRDIADADIHTSRFF